ncbi:hypothetical protein G6F50_015927 [Rhizopus delemar]|uniref:Uncharacterized protein n=1 Tax=Rhizopus delemar TaxID=936053 RepID=A0A9P7C3B7_9FUNG|nr:hypothetical protein G6F50_015927 [Rhizopus delemar]
MSSRLWRVVARKNAGGPCLDIATYTRAGFRAAFSLRYAGHGESDLLRHHAPSLRTSRSHSIRAAVLAAGAGARAVGHGGTAAEAQLGILRGFPQGEQDAADALDDAGHMCTPRSARARALSVSLRSAAAITLALNEGNDSPCPCTMPSSAPSLPGLARW